LIRIECSEDTSLWKTARSEIISPPLNGIWEDVRAMANLTNAPSQRKNFIVECKIIIGCKPMEAEKISFTNRSNESEINKVAVGAEVTP